MSTASVLAQKDNVHYVPKWRSAVIEEIAKAADVKKTAEDSVTAAIREQQKKEAEARQESARDLRFDFGKVVKPASPEAFKSSFHFPPQGQFRTGTCWCFSGTSFIESEVCRLTGRKIKLSEMYTVYFEYVEKIRRYVQERGDTWNWEGSEPNAVIRIMKQYGGAPADAYRGQKENDKFDHDRMAGEIESYLGYIKDNNIWDQDQVIESVKLILDRYMGKPPTAFVFDAVMMTPVQFVNEILKVGFSDYVNCLSTLSFPFYTQGEYDVPDNWWHDSTYCNLPLDEWYGVIKNAVREGYAVAIGGDVTEPGYNGFEDAAIVPDFDIPQNYINQDSREFRAYNETTTDDHGVHLVGYTRAGGHDWFLAKDSSRRPPQGKFEGFIFYRDDYIRLKMLSLMVHKDALKTLMSRFQKASAGR